MATTAMTLTDQVKNYPNATITGRNGTVVDTNVDVHWAAGPARVYLHPREVAEAVRVAHVCEEVADVLKAEGWIHGDEHTKIVDELTAAKTDAEQKAGELEEKLKGLLSTISIVSDQGGKPAEPAPAVEPAPKPKHTTARKKKDAQ